MPKIKPVVRKCRVRKCRVAKNTTTQSETVTMSSSTIDQKVGKCGKIEECDGKIIKN